MAKSKQTKETPLMKQYNALKGKYPGALLLFRVGDFYETFGQDAIKASEILDIVLTKRANGSAAHIELAGFPHHAIDTYLPKLVNAGERVAICDQLEDPKTVKGIVKRGVTELVTPGVSFNENVLDKRRNNFLCAVHLDGDNGGLSLLDISTGEFLLAQGNTEYLNKLIQGFAPAEMIFSRDQRDEVETVIESVDSRNGLEEWVFQFDYCYEKLTRHFKTTSLKGFGVETLQQGIIAAGACMHYMEETEHRELDHISVLSRINEEAYVWLDRFTIRNLELIYPQQEGGTPLIDILDGAVTPMGSRLLKKWLVMPLKDKTAIDQRLDTVGALREDDNLLADLTEKMKQLADLERLISKVAVQRVGPREMVTLGRSLGLLAPIQQLLQESKYDLLNQFGDQLHVCEELKTLIETTLKEEVPVSASLGGMIRDGVDPSLDEYRSIAYSGKEVLQSILEREQQKTGISSLKIAYNKVFGYYLEVSNTHKDKVPEGWIRKQTLVNAERYITEELKVYEEKIIKAESEIAVIEGRIYSELVAKSASYVGKVQEDAKTIAKLDCLANFALKSEKNSYCKPEISDDTVIEIKKGRHAVIEKQLPMGEKYIPNDVYLDNTDQQILVITGPNMAGKSAVLRQVALIVLMAQMGSYVPAEFAHIGVVDKVFTRVGASDNLSKGESTFMVEMTETASILNNLSDRCLILMDEIGRGTSTYDGVSIAWSIIEHLHNHPKYRAKTLFATHYHELNQLKEDLPRIKNFNVSVKEVGDKVIFLRKLIEGGSEHSFGIHVAQMAGMPNQVVIRANEILRFLEKNKSRSADTSDLKDVPKPAEQLLLFESDPRFKKITERLSEIDINTISPVEALLRLNELQKILEEQTQKKD